MKLASPGSARGAIDTGRAKEYFSRRTNELLRMCADGTPWVFLCGSAMVDYLAKIVNGRDLRTEGYKRFIRDYLALVRSEYRDFVYKGGMSDLPDQMYHILRCGIVHSFSFIPDARAMNKGGRSRSIVLCHRVESNARGWHHLMQYSSDHIADGALFVAEDFIMDIQRVAELIFKKATYDRSLSGNIKSWLGKHPPIAGGF
jgi:hypothetical protein